MSDLVERLRIDAQKESDASKLLAQAKSLRQGDNPPRDDLYMWLTPEQTLPWKAADHIKKLEAALRPFAKAGELFDQDYYNDRTRLSFAVFFPSKGLEWSISGQDLYNARKALETP